MKIYLIFVIILIKYITTKEELEHTQETFGIELETTAFCWFDASSFEGLTVNQKVGVTGGDDDDYRYAISVDNLGGTYDLEIKNDKPIVFDAIKDLSKDQIKNQVYKPLTDIFAEWNGIVDTKKDADDKEIKKIQAGPLKDYDILVVKDFDTAAKTGRKFVAKLGRVYDKAVGDAFLAENSCPQITISIDVRKVYDLLRKLEDTYMNSRVDGILKTLTGELEESRWWGKPKYNARPLWTKYPQFRGMVGVLTVYCADIKAAMKSKSQFEKAQHAFYLRTRPATYFTETLATIDEADRAGVVDELKKYIKEIFPKKNDRKTWLFDDAKNKVEGTESNFEGLIDYFFTGANNNAFKDMLTISSKNDAAITNKLANGNTYVFVEIRSLCNVVKGAHGVGVVDIATSIDELAKITYILKEFHKDQETKGIASQPALLLENNRLKRKTMIKNQF